MWQCDHRFPGSPWMVSCRHIPPRPHSCSIIVSIYRRYKPAAHGGIHSSVGRHPAIFGGVLVSRSILHIPAAEVNAPHVCPCLAPSSWGPRDPAGQGVRPVVPSSLAGKPLAKRGHGHREVVRKTSSAPQCPSRMDCQTHRSHSRDGRLVRPCRSGGLWASFPFRKPWSEATHVIPAGTWLRDYKRSRGAGKFSSGFSCLSRCRPSIIPREPRSQPWPRHCGRGSSTLR